MVLPISFKTRVAGFMFPIALPLIHQVSSEPQHHFRIFNIICHPKIYEKNSQPRYTYRTQSLCLQPITKPIMSTNKNGYLLFMVYSMVFRQQSRTLIELNTQDQMLTSQGAELAILEGSSPMLCRHQRA